MTRSIEPTNRAMVELVPTDGGAQPGKANHLPFRQHGQGQLRRTWCRQTGQRHARATPPEDAQPTPHVRLRLNVESITRPPQARSCSPQVERNRAAVALESCGGGNIPAEVTTTARKIIWPAASLDSLLPRQRTTPLGPVIRWRAWEAPPDTVFNLSAKRIFVGTLCTNGLSTIVTPSFLIISPPAPRVTCIHVMQNQGMAQRQ